MHVAIVGSDLMIESRVREAAARLGASVSVHESPPAEVAADVMIVDLEAIEPASVATSSARIIGVYPHVRSDLAAAARTAGIEPIPRSRFVRDLDRIVGGETP